MYNIYICIIYIYIYIYIDFVGLYPHIPHEVGILTVKEYLNLAEDQSICTNCLRSSSYNFNKKLF